MGVVTVLVTATLWALLVLAYTKLKDLRINRAFGKAIQSTSVRMMTWQASCTRYKPGRHAMHRKIPHATKKHPVCVASELVSDVNLRKHHSTQDDLSQRGRQAAHATNLADTPCIASLHTPRKSTEFV